MLRRLGRYNLTRFLRLLLAARLRVLISVSFGSRFHFEADFGLVDNSHRGGPRRDFKVALASNHRLIRVKIIASLILRLYGARLARHVLRHAGVGRVGPASALTQFSSGTGLSTFVRLDHFNFNNEISYKEFNSLLLLNYS